MSISGDEITVVATTVNLSSSSSINWAVTKIIEVLIDSNSSVAMRSHTVDIVVVPCEMTGSTIPDITVEIGN